MHKLILKILGSTPDTQVRFILDSRACPYIILLKQIYGQDIEDMVQYLTRTWAYAIHRQKMRLLGRWPEIASHKDNNRTYVMILPDIIIAHLLLTIVTLLTEMMIIPILSLIMIIFLYL